MWENLAEEVALEFVGHATLTDERLDRWLNFRDSSNWRNERNLEYQRHDRSRRREAFDARVASNPITCWGCRELLPQDWDVQNGRIKRYCRRACHKALLRAVKKAHNLLRWEKRIQTPTYCGYCFEVVEQNYKKTFGKIRRYCNQVCSKRATGSCVRLWRLPDGHMPCTACLRAFKPSPQAPVPHFCSCNCYDQVMLGKWKPFLSGPAIPAVVEAPRVVVPQCGSCGGWDNKACRPCKIRMSYRKAAERSRRSRARKKKNEQAA